MDLDDQPYSLGWATDGRVEPRTVHTAEDVSARREAGFKRVAEDSGEEDLDTWWAGISKAAPGRATRLP